MRPVRYPHSPNDPVQDPVEDAVWSLHSSNVEKRQQAALALNRIGDHRAVPALEQMALSDSGTISVEGAFVDSTQEIYPDALEALNSIYEREGIRPEDVDRMNALLHGTFSHRNGTYRVLALGGETMRPLLREALNDSDPQIVLRATKALQLLNEPAVGIAQLSHPDADIRRQTIELDPRPGGYWYETLAQRLPEEPLPELRAAIIKAMRYWQDRTDLPILMRCRQDADLRVRAAAIKKLIVLGSPCFPEIVPELTEGALSWVNVEPDPKTRGSVLTYLSMLPPEPGQPPWRVVFLRDPDPALRQEAARQLGWEKRQIAARPLMKAAADEDAGVRRAALLSLGKLGEWRAIPFLEQELSRPLEQDDFYRLSDALRQLKWKKPETRS